MKTKYQLYGAENHEPAFRQAATPGPTLTPAVEDYLKAIHTLQQRA